MSDNSVQELMDKLGALKTSVDETGKVMTEYKDIEADLRDANKVLAEIVGLIGPYKETVAKYEAMLAENQTMVKNNESAIALMNEKASQIEAEVAKRDAEAKQRIAEKDAEIARLKSDLEKATANSQNVDSLTASLHEIEQQKERLIAEHAEQRTKLEQELAAANAEKARLAEENAKSADESLQYKTTIATAGTAISELTGRLNSMVNGSNAMQTMEALGPFRIQLDTILNQLRQNQGRPKPGPRPGPRPGPGSVPGPSPSRVVQTSPPESEYNTAQSTDTFQRVPETSNNPANMPAPGAVGSPKGGGCAGLVPRTSTVADAYAPGLGPRVGGKRRNTGRRRTKSTRKSTKRHKTQRKQKKKRRGTYRAKPRH
jgi:hypothetical protein